MVSIPKKKGTLRKGKASSEKQKKKYLYKVLDWLE